MHAYMLHIYVYICIKCIYMYICIKCIYFTYIYILHIYLIVVYNKSLSLMTVLVPCVYKKVNGFLDFPTPLTDHK